MTLNEVSQQQKDKYCMFSLIYGSWSIDLIIESRTSVTKGWERVWKMGMREPRQWAKWLLDRGVILCSLHSRVTSCN
jgi:hypothetical protein